MELVSGLVLANMIPFRLADEDTLREPLTFVESNNAKIIQPIL
jgi:hypothetical protein